MKGSATIIYSAQRVCSSPIMALLQPYPNSLLHATTLISEGLPASTHLCPAACSRPCSTRTPYGRAVHGHRCDNRAKSLTMWQGTRMAQKRRAF